MKKMITFLSLFLISNQAFSNISCGEAKANLKTVSTVHLEEVEKRTKSNNKLKNEIEKYNVMLANGQSQLDNANVSYQRRSDLIDAMNKVREWKNLNIFFVTANDEFIETSNNDLEVAEDDVNYYCNI